MSSPKTVQLPLRLPIPATLRRSSFGRVTGGFTPDLSKTFNRGYTELYLDGKRGPEWSSMDAPANLGTFVGTVRRLRRDRSGLEITLSSAPELHNGDGFAFLKGSSWPSLVGTHQPAYAEKTAGWHVYRHHDCFSEAVG